jgi:hypothetical protein
MTANEIIDEAFNLFDESSGSKYDSDTRAWPLRLVNIGYREICEKTRCSRTSYALSTVANTKEYSLPSGFLAMHSVDYAGYYRLDPIGFQRAEKEFALNDTGQPAQYYLAVDKIGLVPTPASVYTVNLYYFNGPTSDLTINDTPSLVPTAYHYVLAYYVVSKLFQIDKGADSNRALFWKGLYEEELDKMKTYYQTRLSADRKTEM